MMQVLEQISEFRKACESARKGGQTIALVPTMGALHAGHLDLVRVAKQHADVVAVSIFVNPTQFGPGEDLAKYPRDLDGDVSKLTAAGVSLVFAPGATAMYLPGDETRVRVGALAASLCGPKRPGHFEGVATVVTKLLAITGPCTAVFGKKDYQQLAVLRRVVADLFLPVNVVGVPIVREADGLAMSSRNVYLSSEERTKALALITGLRAAATTFHKGERHAGVLRELAEAPVREVAKSIDYVTIADPDSLASIDDDAVVGERALLAVAAYVGATRLIDNVVLGEPV